MKKFLALIMSATLVISSMVFTVSAYVSDPEDTTAVETTLASDPVPDAGITHTSLTDVTVVLNSSNVDEAQGILYTLDKVNMTATVGLNTFSDTCSSGYVGNGVVIIPDDVTDSNNNTYAVTKIGKNAFDESMIKVVYIGNNVDVIGEMAFCGCEQLTTVVMGSGVTEIKGFAFWHCSNLISVTIGEAVKTIGGCAFWNCIKLKTITLPDSCTQIMEKAFWFCTALTNVYYLGEAAPTCGANVFADTADATLIEAGVATISVGTVYTHAGETAYVPVTVIGNTITNEDITAITVDALTDATLGDIILTGANYGVIMIIEVIIPAETTQTTFPVSINTTYTSTDGAAIICQHTSTTRIVTIAPSCVDTGTAVIKCNDCQVILSTETILAVGHTWDSGVKGDGVIHYTCTVCGATKDEVIPHTPGDINDDSSVDANDISILLKHLAKWSNIVINEEAADTNGDGSINASDVSNLLKYLAHWQGIVLH